MVPVSDVNRAKSFYETLGFRMAIDHVASSENFRVVQLTPPGPECSIIIGNGITSAVPGSVEEDVDSLGDDCSPIRKTASMQLESRPRAWICGVSNTGCEPRRSKLQHDDGGQG